MSAIDDYGKTETQSEEEDSSESVTYVEISSVDHNEAYKLLSQKGVIRQNAPVNELYADLTVALGPFFEEGDKLPLIRWILENGEGELDTETLGEFLSDHDVEVSTNED